MVPDSQVMVEKILKLQGKLAKKAEKVEFLEEHVSTLLNEIKKKNKIIQGYVMNQETGALTPEAMDNNKVSVRIAQWVRQIEQSSFLVHLAGHDQKSSRGKRGTLNGLASLVIAHVLILLA